jgi:lipid II:glycine glycyltransferase (peptidoglycan interpeptide bridge formation enzyme)
MGVKTYFADKEIDLRDFYRLYVQTRKKISLPVHPFRFFHNMWDYFQSGGQLSLVMARKGMIPIAGLIIFHFKNRVSAEYLAYDKEYLVDYCPNHLLFWEAIKMAFEKGFEIFDFGRTPVLNKGLMLFKAKWGTKIVDIPIYYYPSKIAEKKSRDLRDLRYKTLRNICGIIPVSLQTIFGDLIYRHLG